MPIFRLPKEIIFPPPDLAEEDGLLAVGGDLSEKRLLMAYSMGIFPWYSDGSPILWWSPDPRLVLLPADLRVSRSLRHTIKKGVYKVTMDKAFDQVIQACASVRGRKNEGTWITGEMMDSYGRLHHSGFAHSVESWEEGELVGGLYGVSLGGAFFGESMFTRKADASKVAFVALVRRLLEWNFRLIDCQVRTQHLISLGAIEIPRAEFMTMLRHALTIPTHKGKWTI